MRGLILHIILLLVSSSLFAQDFLEEMKGISSLEEARSFADSLPQVKLAFLHPEIQNQEYVDRHQDLKPGDTYKTGNYRVFIVSEGSKEVYRFRLLTLTQRQTDNAAEQAQKIFDELKDGLSFEQLFDEYAENKMNGNRGDVGWVDPEFFIKSFRNDLQGKTKGDQFLSIDQESGWYNIVDMTHNPKTTSGHFVLFYPEVATNSVPPEVNHEKNIQKLTSQEELRSYAKGYPGDVSLQLLNKIASRELFDRIIKRKGEVRKKEPVFIDDGTLRYRWIRDTSVELLSVQYIYLNGAKLSRDAKNEAIHDIYDQFHSNVPFDTIVKQYWPDNNGLSIMRNIEGSLLDEDFASKVRSTTVGQLFVARVGQSYFLGVPLEKPRKVDAVLVLAYPKPLEE